MSDNNKEKQKIGVLWHGTSAAGNEYVRGIIEINGKENSFVGFLNKHPKSEKSPQFFLFESEPRQPANQSSNRKPAKAAVKTEVPVNEEPPL